MNFILEKPQVGVNKHKTIKKYLSRKDSLRHFTVVLSKGDTEKGKSVNIHKRGTLRSRQTPGRYCGLQPEAR